MSFGLGQIMMTPPLDSPHLDNQEEFLAHGAKYGDWGWLDLNFSHSPRGGEIALARAEGQVKPMNTDDGQAIPDSPTVFITTIITVSSVTESWEDLDNWRSN